jgi:DNA-binding transcriptional LysR family regulator
MKLIRNSEIGELAFGAGPLPTAAFLPALLQALAAERPSLRLKVGSNNWRYLLQHLHAEEIEFFISDTRDIEADQNIRITPLCRQFAPFLCRAGHPLLTRPDRQPRDLLAYGFAALKLPRDVQAALRQLCGIAPHEVLPISVECDNVAVLSQRAQESDAILLVTEAAVAAEIKEGRLARLQFDGLPSIYAEIGIVQLYGRNLSPAAGLVLDALRIVAARSPSTVMYTGTNYQAWP